MMTVTDDLTVQIMNTESSADQSRFAVMKGSHTIVYMSHGRGTISHSHQCSFVIRRRMSHADNHTVTCTVLCQCKIFIMLRA